MAFGLVPGFPTIIFFGIGGLLFALSRFVLRNPEAAKRLTESDAEREQHRKTKEAATAPQPTGPDAVLPLLAVDPLEFEIGYSLTRLADKRAGGDLPDRVSSTRRQVALELGFVMPSVRIRDSISLNAYEYVIKVRGEEVARAEVSPSHLMAIDSGSVIVPVAGRPAQEPVFGLSAVWIEPDQREAAERGGYTVIEPTAVMATHLSEVVKSYAAELITRQDVASLIENARQSNDTVVNELVPGVVNIGDIQKVLQHLLRERVPIRDMVTILETMADFAGRLKDSDQLGEVVRSAISRTLTRQYSDDDGVLWCLTLEPVMERKLADAVQQTAAGFSLALDPNEQNRFIDDLSSQFETAMAEGKQPVLLCSNHVRLALRRLIERYIPNLHVMAYSEVAAKAQVEFVGQLRAAA